MGFDSVLYLLTSIIALSVLLFYLIYGKNCPLLKSFTFLLLTVLIWSFGLFLEEIIADRKTDWYILKFYYSGICFIGYAWLIFVLYYINNKYVSKASVRVSLSLIPLTSYFMLLSNEIHGLFYRVDGMNYRFSVFFWIMYLYSLICVILGNTLLIKHSVKYKGIKKLHFIILILSALIPLLFNIVFMMLKLKTEITPFSFIIALVILTFASLKYRFLDIESLALKNYISQLPDAFLLLNHNFEIESYNNSFKGIIDTDKLNGHEDFKNILDTLDKNSYSTEEQKKILSYLKNRKFKRITGEIILKKNEVTTFEINIMPLTNKKGSFIGLIISFHNVQKYKDLLNDINDKNIELNAINDQLAEYAQKVEELSILKERNRISRDLHDNIGHSLTTLISLTEALKISNQKNTEKSKEIIEKINILSKTSLKELRDAVSGMLTSNTEFETFNDALAQITDKFSYAGIDVDIMFDEDSKKLNKKCFNELYLICKESLTNSVKHGNAKSIKLIFQKSDTALRLFIFDDGIGCKNIKKGMGLKGIEERVKNLSGKVIYGSDGEKGFNIHIEIPLLGGKND
jgi:signal transduction histidine kinase